MTFLVNNISGFKGYYIAFYAFALGLLVAFIALKGILSKKVDIVGIVLSVLTLAYLFFPKETYSKYILVGFSVLCLIYTFIRVYFYSLNSLKKKRRNQKIIEQVKSDTADFYMSLDNKYTLIDYSPSFASIAGVSKKDIANKDGFDIIFKRLNVKKINGNECITSNIKTFKEHLDEANNKFKKYQFTLDIEEKNGRIVHYIGLIQPLYLGKKNIGMNVFFYQDKMNLVTDLDQNLQKALICLEKQKNITQILMSLSEGVCLYFDYQEKIYFATESFINYVGYNKSRYEFREIFDMIDEDDKKSYMEQAETISSINVTRIKFRLHLKDTVYFAVEDAIYLGRDCNELISLIHLVGKYDTYPGDSVLSTKEANTIIDNLSENIITPVVYDTIDLLDRYTQDANAKKDETNE